MFYLTFTGEEWLRNRKAANPSLMPPHVVANYRSAQHDAAKDFLRYMESLRHPTSGEINSLESCLNKWALESVAIALLGTRCELINNNRFTYPR